MISVVGRSEHGRVISERSDTIEECSECSAGLAMDVSFIEERELEQSFKNRTKMIEGKHASGKLTECDKLDSTSSIRSAGDTKSRSRSNKKKKQKKTFAGNMAETRKCKTISRLENSSECD